MESFVDLSLSISGDDNVRYVNAKLSCNSVVLYKHRPQTRVFVSRGWLWWIISKIFRQVVHVVFVSARLLVKGKGKGKGTYA